MVVNFTEQEMQRAWRNNLQAYQRVDDATQDVRTNAHRLLLFYSIECGLKVLLMRKNAANFTNDCPNIKGHDINRLLDNLAAGHSLKVPYKIIMTSSSLDRILNSGDINQMWRYGGEATGEENQQGTQFSFSDEDLEQRLLNISDWIRERLH